MSSEDLAGILPSRIDRHNVGDFTKSKTLRQNERQSLTLRVSLEFEDCSGSISALEAYCRQVVTPIVVIILVVKDSSTNL